MSPFKPKKRKGMFPMFGGKHKDSDDKGKGRVIRGHREGGRSRLSLSEKDVQFLKLFKFKGEIVVRGSTHPLSP